MMAKPIQLAFIFSAGFLLFSCNKNEKEDTNNPGIKIGTQIWSTENLNVSTFVNGDAIPEAKTEAEWKNAGLEEKAAWCYYEYNPANGAKYGKLYNWYAVNDPRGLAPQNWHISTNEEWATLINFLGSGEAGTKMKSPSGWNDHNGQSGNGDNSSGFSGLPGGSVSYDGVFSFIGCVGFFWTATEINTAEAWYRHLSCGSPEVFSGPNFKNSGYSCRCVKN